MPAGRAGGRVRPPRLRRGSRPRPRASPCSRWRVRSSSTRRGRVHPRRLQLGRPLGSWPARQPPLAAPSRLDALDRCPSLAGDAAVIDGPLMAETWAVSMLRRSGARWPHRAHPPRRARGERRRTVAAAGSYSSSHGLLAEVAYQTLSGHDLKELDSRNPRRTSRNSA